MKSDLVICILLSLILVVKVADFCMSWKAELRIRSIVREQISEVDMPRAKKPVVVEPQRETPPVRPQSPRSTILRVVDGELVPFHSCEVGSQDYKEALDTPGLYVQNPDGEVVAGKQ